MLDWVGSLLGKVLSWSIQDRDAKNAGSTHYFDADGASNRQVPLPQYMLPKQAPKCFDLVRLFSEVPRVWTVFDLQSRQHLGTVNRQLRIQRRKHTPYRNVRAPTIRHSGAFALQMKLMSTDQLHMLDVSDYSMSTQDMEVLCGYSWPKLQVLQLKLCTSSLEECCSGITALADGHWPALCQLWITHVAVPLIFSRSGEAAIRLFLRGRWPELRLQLSSNLWPSKDERCAGSVEQMLLDAAPGDEYRDMLHHSALTYSTAAGAVFEELQRTHVYVRRQWCQHLRAVLEVQKTMAHWVHMRQARISGDPFVDRLSASMQETMGWERRKLIQLRQEAEHNYMLHLKRYFPRTHAAYQA